MEHNLSVDVIVDVVVALNAARHCNDETAATTTNRMRGER